MAATLADQHLQVSSYATVAALRPCGLLAATSSMFNNLSRGGFNTANFTVWRGVFNNIHPAIALKIC